MRISAIFPCSGGKIADLLIQGGNDRGLQISYLVPLMAYAYVAFYGAFGHKIGRLHKRESAN